MVSNTIDASRFSALPPARAIITGIAIPNSILSAFLLMNAMDFTINMLTLLALSLTVGLLVDDAIVVRENIFRKLQSGMDAKRAAEDKGGSRGVRLATGGALGAVLGGAAGAGAASLARVSPIGGGLVGGLLGAVLGGVVAGMSGDEAET